MKGTLITAFGIAILAVSSSLLLALQIWAIVTAIQWMEIL